MLDAILKRKSRRFYNHSSLPIDITNHLCTLINEYNYFGDLHFQLVMNNPKPFSQFSKFGLFSGLSNYIALVGSTVYPDCAEKIGYYGEKLVLDATNLDLGTCWITSTYNPEYCMCNINPGEMIFGLIAIGTTDDQLHKREKIVRDLLKRNSKEEEEFFISNEQPPQWFNDGIASVMQAPSAANCQPVVFTYEDDIVRAKSSGTAFHIPIDLGIAKLHFELGANSGKWEWGNGAKFIKD